MKKGNDETVLMPNTYNIYNYKNYNRWVIWVIMTRIEMHYSYKLRSVIYIKLILSANWVRGEWRLKNGSKKFELFASMYMTV